MVRCVYVSHFSLSLKDTRILNSFTSEGPIRVLFANSSSRYVCSENWPAELFSLVDVKIL